MKELKRLINDQLDMVNYYKNAKTRTDKLWAKENIDEIEELINAKRKELGLD